MIWLILSLVSFLVLISPGKGLISIRSQLFCQNTEIQTGQIIPSTDILWSFSVRSLTGCALKCAQRQQGCVAFNIQQSKSSSSGRQECQLGKKKLVPESDLSFNDSFKYYERCSQEATPSSTLSPGSSSGTRALLTTTIKSGGVPTTSMEPPQITTKPSTTTTGVTTTEIVGAAATVKMRIGSESDFLTRYLLFSGSKIYAYLNPNFHDSNNQPTVLDWSAFAPSVSPPTFDIVAATALGDGNRLFLFTKDGNVIKLETQWSGPFVASTASYTDNFECYLTADVQTVVEHDDELATCIYIKTDGNSQSVFGHGYNVMDLKTFLSELISNGELNSPITASLALGPANNPDRIVIFMGFEYIVIELPELITGPSNIVQFLKKPQI